MTNNTNKIIEILLSHGITLASPISLSHCKITRSYKLENAGFNPNGELFAVIIAVPYLTLQKEKNISAYAVPKDYHLFFDKLFESVIPKLKAEFPENLFAGFADNSPIDERLAAAKTGLGIIGDNGLLITKKYSSYVFLGEIITDLPLDYHVGEVAHCEGCGACKKACPMEEIGECLSSLTQKKGELTRGEAGHIKKYGTAWGCDLCQEQCPHTKRAIKDGTIYTDISFFKEDTVSVLRLKDIEYMSDEAFKKRAYSWRGKKVISRNLNILEEK